MTYTDRQLVAELRRIWFERYAKDEQMRPPRTGWAPETVTQNKRLKLSQPQPPAGIVDGWPTAPGQVLFFGLRNYDIEKGWHGGTRNKWDDMLGCIVASPDARPGRIRSAFEVHRYRGTTDPGRFQKRFHKEGDLWLMPGLYWIVPGKHHGKNAFRFVGEITISRDRDKNGIPGEPGEVAYETRDALQRGERYHGGGGENVGANSAGCMATKGWKAIAEQRQITDEARSSCGQEIFPFFLGVENDFRAPAMREV